MIWVFPAFIKSNGLQWTSFDLIKAGATQTETSLLKQYVAGERVDLLDDYDFPARTITETILRGQVKVLVHFL